MSALPEAFLQRMKIKLGDDYENFIAAFLLPAPVSVRKNVFKPSSVFSNEEKIPWSTGSYYLKERISFTLDPLFHAGCYYVQEASSMYLEAAFSLVEKKRGLKVLDLCAAPGGKSVHLLSMMPGDSLLVSNEIVPARNKILRQNLSRWGCSNVIVTQQEAKDFSKLKGYFDVIVVDAPCSGEGLFRKDPGATDEWSQDAVNRCAARQTEILESIVPSLATGGILIYSTCTYENAENDDAGEYLNKTLNLEPIEITNPINQIVRTKYGLQFYPHKIKGEGFYISAFRKNGIEDKTRIKVKEKFPNGIHTLISPYLEEPQKFSGYLKNEEVYAIPAEYGNDFLYMTENFFVRQAGIHIGTRIRESVIPSHQLALSVDRNSALPSIELDRENALDFLRCKNILLGDALPGWYIATYENHSLGWMKQLGNRMNNYLPKENRIFNL